MLVGILVSTQLVTSSLFSYTNCSWSGGIYEPLSVYDLRKLGYGLAVPLLPVEKKNGVGPAVTFTAWRDELKWFISIVLLW